MAKDILYIEDGSLMAAAGHIMISGDGNAWDGISKVGLSATLHNVSLNSSAKNSYPERNKESGYVITIKGLDSEGAILKFNPKKVLNQPTWVDAGETDFTNAQFALGDILSWLA